MVQFFGQSEITRVEWNRRHPLSTLTAARVTPVGGKGVHGAASNDLSAAACETSSTGRGTQFFLASELSPCCVFNTRRDPFKKMTTCRHDSPCAKGLHCLFPWEVNVFEMGFPGGPRGKEPACQCRRHRFNPWVRKIPWRKNGNPLQYSSLGYAMDRGAWQLMVHGAAKSQI